MRVFPSFPTRSRHLALALLAAALAGPAYAATITVTSSADSGVGTLRNAITTANGNGTADTIEFDSSVTAITLSTELPTISEQLTIDGTVNHSAGTYIDINGSAVTAPGLTVSANNSTVKGLYLHGFSGVNGYGIRITASGATIRGNVISGCGADGIQSSGTGTGIYGNIIGLNTAGTAAAPNGGDGVEVNAAGATVGTSSAADRNIISGNSGHGVRTTSTTAVVEGNYIGTSADGTADLGNGGDGVVVSGTGAVVRGNLIAGNTGNQVSSSNSGTGIYGNIIGFTSGGAAMASGGHGVLLQNSSAIVGTTAVADRNVIGNCASDGVNVAGTNATVQGNYIGLDPTGAIDSGNGASGVAIGSSGATVRDNAISGNTGDGILATTGGAQIHGNIVGLSASGTTAVGNGGDGIRITAGTVTIGSASNADRNVVSGNAGSGIRTTGSSATIRNNYVGTDATGSSDRGNALLGIYVHSSAHTSTVRDNLIAGNEGTQLQMNGDESFIHGNVVGFSASGANIPSGGTGIEVTSSAPYTLVGTLSTTDRNVVGNCAAGGIVVAGANAAVRGNYVGIGPNGLTDGGNTGNGITISSSGIAVEGNLVGGNTGDGILIDSIDARVMGNTVGLGSDGATAIGNDGDGVELTANATGVGFGSSTTTDRNVVAASGVTELRVLVSDITIEGNYFGTNTTGLLDRGSSSTATVLVNANNVNVIGNVISGGAGDGLQVQNSTAMNIRANMVGLSSDGATALGNGGDGIEIAATTSNTLIGGGAAERNLISANGANGINVAGTNVNITGNYVGTDTTGLLDRGNTANGLSLAGASPTVRDNVISGNNGDGINASGTGLAIHANTIGLGADGSTIIRNDSDGIELTSSATGLVGAGTIADRNVISGNNVNEVLCNAPGFIIEGNFLGTDATGLLDKGATTQAGISLAGAGAISSANVISGGGASGVRISAANCGVYACTIGLGSDGSTVIPNALHGINVLSSGSGAIIGSSNPADRNIISGNGQGGVSTSGPNSAIVGNFVGLDVSGAIGKPNGNSGVAVRSTASGTTISGNTISYNAQSGMYIDSNNTLTANNTITNNGQYGIVLIGSSAVGNAVQANSIHSNTLFSLGVEWWGPFSNDALDADGAGANNLQNWPAIGPVRPGDSALVGTLSSAASRSYRLDFYLNTACHSSGYGDLRQWLGTTNVTTDAGGSAPFTFTLPAAAIAGEGYAATATDLTTNDTSSPSRCVTVSADPVADPTIVRATGSTNPTSGPTAEFDVAFDKLVGGLGASDLAVQETGGLSGSAVSGVTTQFGNALKLVDGEAFTVPAGNLDLSNRSFTIEFWVKRDAVTDTHTDIPVAFAGTESANNYLHLGWRDHYSFRFGFFGNDLSSSHEWGVAREWEHWACTYDFGTGARRIYRNGILAGSGTTATPFASSTAKLIVGVNSQGQLAGAIDELRIWGVARTAPEIQASYATAAAGTEPNLLALYRFEALEDLGVNSDGADDIADVVGGRALDRSAGTGAIIASTVPTTTARVTVTTGTGTGQLGLSVLTVGSALDVDGFRIVTNAAPSETFTIQPVSAVNDWQILND